MNKLYDLIIYLYRHQLIRYMFSGGVAAVVNLTLLFALVHWWGIYYLVASIISFMAGFVVTFILQKYFTFSDYTKHRIPRQTGLFFVMHSVNLGLNTLLMYIGVSILNIHYIVAQIITGGLIAISSFLISKNVIFKPLPSVDAHSEELLQ